MASRFECSLCLDRFSDPRFLPCPGHHTFCRGCIESYLIKTVETTQPGTEFKCPNCRSLVKLPKDGVSGLTVNYYLVETKQERPISTYNSCTKHPDEDLRFYCMVCKEVICRDCKVISHEGHKIDMVKDVIAKLKEDIETILDVAATDLNAREHDLCENIAKEVESYQKSLENVETVIRTLKTKLDDVQEALTSAIKPGHEDAKKRSETIHEWAFNSNERITSYKNLLDQNCRGTSVETVKALEELRIKSRNIHENNAPPKIEIFADSSSLVEEEATRFSGKVLTAANNFQICLINHFTSDARRPLPSRERQTETDARGQGAAGTSNNTMGSFKTTKPKKRGFLGIRNSRRVHTSVGSNADWPALGRRIRALNNVPWVPEMVCVQPPSEVNFPLSQKIVVGHIPSETNEEELRKFFETYGTTVGMEFEPEKDFAILIYDNPATVHDIIKRNLKQPVCINGYRLNIERMDDKSKTEM